MRAVMGTLRKGVRRMAIPRYSAARTLLGRVARFVRNRPTLHAWLGQRLDRHPQVKAFIKRAAIQGARSNSPSAAPHAAVANGSALAPTAAAVYADLTRALGERATDGSHAKR